MRANFKFPGEDVRVNEITKMVMESKRPDLVEMGEEKVKDNIRRVLEFYKDAGLVDPNGHHVEDAAEIVRELSESSMYDSKIMELNNFVMSVSEAIDSHSVRHGKAYVPCQADLEMAREVVSKIPPDGAGMLIEEDAAAYIVSRRDKTIKLCMRNVGRCKPADIARIKAIFLVIGYRMVDTKMD